MTPPLLGQPRGIDKEIRLPHAFPEGPALDAAPGMRTGGAGAAGNERITQKPIYKPSGATSLCGPLHCLMV